MTIAVIVLRMASILAFAAPILLRRLARPSSGPTPAGHASGAPVPVIANFAAVGVFFPSLIVFSHDAGAFMALPFALAGFALAAAGAVLVVLSRMELGSAWSLAPGASPDAGLVTSGPYDLVRHPIYLGFVLMALGQAVAFGSWPAVAIVVFALIPSFAWRARVEEELLGRMFGERYAAYRRRTKLIIPGLL